MQISTYVMRILNVDEILQTRKELKQGERPNLQWPPSYFLLPFRANVLWVVEMLETKG